MTSDQLEELVPRCRQGDTEALRVIYEDLHQEIFAFVVGRVPDREGAMDVVHDSFLDLWKGLQTFEYRSLAGFYRYVYTIVRRRLAKTYKLSSKETPFEDFMDMPDEAPLPDTLEPYVLQRELNKLNDLDRSIIELRYWSGLSVREVAERLGLSESNVKVRHHRAIRVLQEVILKYE